MGEPPAIIKALHKIFLWCQYFLWMHSFVCAEWKIKRWEGRPPFQGEMDHTVRTTEKNSLQKFCRTDMASELFRTQTGTEKESRAQYAPGIHYETRRENGVETEILTVENEDASSRLGKSIGTYYTIHTGDLCLLGREGYEACRQSVRAALSDAIRILSPGFSTPNRPLKTTIEDAGEIAWDRLAVSPEWDQGGHFYPTPPALLDPEDRDPHQNDLISGCDRDTDGPPDVTAITDIPPCPEADDENPAPLCVHSVLCVGLGNPELTPDALGPMCVGRLNVTRHLRGGDSPLSRAMQSSLHSLSAFCPMVVGQTGIETQALVQGAVRAVQPDLVILIDALAASEMGSLARTVQISTTGIHPGGGIGNRRSPLTEETLGVPTLTIGVPTVIAASTMIYRALEVSGLLPEDPTDRGEGSLPHILSSSDGSFVSPKDTDLSVREFAHLLADVLNEVILGRENASEWARRA